MMDDGFGSNIGGDFGDAGVEGGGGLFDEPVMAEVSNAPSEPRIGSFRRNSMSDDGFDAGMDMFKKNIHISRTTADQKCF